MAEVVLVKFKAKGRRDAGEMPLGASQLTDQTGSLFNRKAEFLKLKKHFIPPERLVSWYKVTLGCRKSSQLGGFLKWKNSSDGMMVGEGVLGR